jgi:hypothetical protein
MQRIHDNGGTAYSLPGMSPESPLSPASPQAAQTSSTMSSATARGRRASAHPSLTHQGQMKKTSHRSNAPPPLSISVPSAPEQTSSGNKSRTPSQQPQVAKQERTKTVQFSDLDDASEASCDSSICHSPSWEDWGKRQKKKKQPQHSKSDSETKDDKSGLTPKKKTNKLSKAQNQDAQKLSPLTATDRSMSAPHLAIPPKSDRRKTMGSTPDILSTAAMSASEQNREPPLPSNDAKRKSKGFLSGFRTRASVDVSRPPPVKSHSVGPGVEFGQANAISPTSIKRLVTTGRSQSSMDRRTPAVRPPSSGSTRGHSQSFLSSTLNKLKGSSQPSQQTSDANDIEALARLKSHDVEIPLSRPDEPSVPKLPAHQPIMSDSTQSTSWLVSSPHLPTHRTRESSPNFSMPTQKQAGGDHRRTGSGPKNNQKRAVNEGSKSRIYELPSSSDDEDYSSARENQSTLSKASRRRLRDSDEYTIRPRKTSDPVPSLQRAAVDTSSPTIGKALSIDPTDKRGPLRDTQKAQGRSDKPSDYFNFINETYLPPSLELRSPLDNMLKSLRLAESPDGMKRSEQLRPSSRGNQAAKTATTTRPSSQGAAESPAVKAEIRSHKESVSSSELANHSKHSSAPLDWGHAPPKNLGRIESEFPSPGMDHTTETSRTTSERSSSSTYDDAPSSPSTATTLDSSRPQSYKDSMVSPNDGWKDLAAPVIYNDSRPGSSESGYLAVPRPGPGDGNWSKGLAPMDSDSSSTQSETAPRFSWLPTPASMTFAEALKEEIDIESAKPSSSQTLPPRAQSALDLPSPSFLPPLKHQPLGAKKHKPRLSTPVLSEIKSSDKADETRRPVSMNPAAMSPSSKRVSQDLVPTNAFVQDVTQAEETRRPASMNPLAKRLSQDLVSASAYLQEARKAVAAAPTNPSRSVRPQQMPKGVPVSVKTAMGTDPIAKMLVECCSCKFLHDMPSRVYECMAKPDSVVEDKMLGVSAAITTMVKCPWCGHGMTTRCCAGYAAVVFLKEKLHGK